MINKHKVKVPVLALLLFITCLAQCFKKSINEATHSDLVLVYGIKNVKATQILEERQKGDFKGIDDFRQRMKGKRVGEVSIKNLSKEFTFR